MTSMAKERGLLHKKGESLLIDRHQLANRFGHSLIRWRENQLKGPAILNRKA
jgi:hypothetical protein